MPSTLQPHSDAGCSEADDTFPVEKLAQTAAVSKLPLASPLPITEELAPVPSAQSAPVRGEADDKSPSFQLQAGPRLHYAVLHALCM